MYRYALVYRQYSVQVVRLEVLRGLPAHLGLFGKQDGMDIRQDTSGGNGDISQELVEFLVILDGERNVTGNDAGLFVVPGGVSSQLEDFSAEIFQDGRQVDGSSGTHAGGILALTEVTSDTTDGELQASLGARRGRSRFVSAASLSFS
jgi:hypothetical protein